jgi:hypothetical protein
MKSWESSAAPIRTYARNMRPNSFGRLRKKPTILKIPLSAWASAPASGCRIRSNSSNKLQAVLLGFRVVDGYKEPKGFAAVAVIPQTHDKVIVGFRA